MRILIYSSLTNLSKSTHYTRQNTVLALLRVSQEEIFPQHVIPMSADRRDANVHASRVKATLLTISAQTPPAHFQWCVCCPRVQTLTCLSSSVCAG